MNFIENESPEKLRGGYYTDPEIARFLVQWVKEIAPESVLEPSCGNGVFIEALAADQKSPIQGLTACELLASEADKARQATKRLHKKTKSRVIEADFLGWVLDQLDTRMRYDAAVGNPPFIRYQYLDPELQDRSKRIFERFDLPFTKHTNAWVPFIIGSLAMLRPGGRLAMVVPAELLHVLHATSLRSFLLENCSQVLVVDPEEIWFKKTLQGVVLLLAQRKNGSDEKTGLLSVNRVSGRSFLEEGPQSEVEKATFIPGQRLGKKWMTALLTTKERSLLEGLQELPEVRRFREIAHVAVGIVTGANKFFLVPDAIVQKHELSEFAHPMFGRSEHVPGVLYDRRTHQENRDRGLPTNFLWFNGVAPENLPEGARAYIEAGESDRLHTRYKCRIRDPWYSVPSVFTAPVGMLKRSHDYPRLILNSVGAFTTDTAYRVRTKGRTSAKRLVFSFVNSLTALSAELEGRHYGGGVLELVPSEINQTLIPYIPDLDYSLPQLDGMFRSKVPTDDILRIQDEQILSGLGLRKTDLDSLNHAWRTLRDRRQRAETPPVPSAQPPRPSQARA